jgi:ABC-type glycerol-3-phosphate transport system permease component
MTNYKIKHILGQTVFHIVVILLGFLMLYPILWMVSNSFKDNAEIFNSSSLIPETFRFDNYVRGWKFNNSVTLPPSSTILSTTPYFPPSDRCSPPPWWPTALPGFLSAVAPSGMDACS